MKCYSKYLPVVLILILVLLGCAKTEINEKEAQKILQDFYTDKTREDLLDRHLLRAGKAIVSYLVIEIQNKDMPRRRYAILALGKIGDRRALPILETILDDKSEIEYFRGDALISIWKIDEKLGEDLSKKYKGENKQIDSTIQLLKDKDSYLWEED